MTSSAGEMNWATAVKEVGVRDPAEVTVCTQFGTNIIGSPEPD